MDENRSVMTGRGLSGFDLKCIAVFSMLVDHIGAFLFPSQVWMRYVGRLAFPIFGFLVVEGFLHTRSMTKYMGRLLLFALISEVPYDLVCYNTLDYKDHQNIFFTLLLALICMYALQTFREQFLQAVGVLVVVGALTHYIIKPDYGIGGIVMILCFYLFRMRRMEQFLSVAAINICYYGEIQRAGALALIPIWFYNGKKGPSAKYFFYVFYPVHLFLLYLIRRYVTYVV